MKKAVGRPRQLNLDEGVTQFFPKTSRMGGGIVTPWDKQRVIKRKGEPKIPHLRLPRVAVYTPL